jgi:single-strand DNA-binding protein
MIGNQSVTNFSLRTEHFYKLDDGTKVCETSHHCIVAFEGGDVDTGGLARESLVHLNGRLRTNKYTSADGSERFFTEVIASSLKVME